MTQPPFPPFLNLEGKVTFYQQLKDRGFDMVALPPFECFVITTLDALLSSAVTLMAKVAELEAAK